MQDTYTFDAKRVFSAVVAAATIAFSVGAGALVAPHQAAAASAGDIFRGTTLSTVYYYGFDGDRHVFPNVKTFETWYGDFSEVKMVADSVLNTIALSSKNVVVRPGAWWVKIDSVNKVYAVAANGQMHWIESEQVAKDFAGSDWSKRIIDIPDALYGNYNIGTSLMTAKAYEGALVANGGKIWLVQSGSIREVTPAGMTANRFASKFILDGGNVDISGLTVGTPVTAREASLVDAAQGGAVVAPVGGSVTVSRASSSPVGTSVPTGANAVDTVSFDVQAGSSAASVSGVTLSLTGIGSVSNIASVYLYQGGKRLTDARSVNTSTRQVTFSNLGVSLAAGQMTTLTARVEVASGATAADTFGFDVASASSISASGAVSGSFPVKGGIFTVASQPAGTITIAKSGSISSPTIGQQNAKIAEFKLTAAGEAVDVHAVTLNIDNAADHNDFKLYQGSSLLATGAVVKGDSVFFDLGSNAYFIDKGNNRTFSVTATTGGQTADEVRVWLDNSIDLVATGRDYGFGTRVINSTFDGSDGADSGSQACSSSTDNCSYSTVQGGKVTLAFNGPSAGDIQVNSQDQTLLKFSITTANTVTLKDLYVNVYGDDDGDNTALDGAAASADNDTSDNTGLINGTSTIARSLTDIKIKNLDTGAIVWGPLELGSTDQTGASNYDALQALHFTEDTYLPAGTKLNLAVTADVDDNVTSGTEFAAQVVASSLNIEDERGDALTVGTDIVPSTSISGYDQQALGASVAVALASSATDVTTIKGAKNVISNAFTLSTGNGGSVKVTDVTANLYGDDDNSGFTAGGVTGADVNDYIESCSLFDGSTLVGSAQSPNTAGTAIVFNNLNWTLPAGSVATLTTKCDYANPSVSASAYFAVEINGADITAVDADGNSVSASGTAVNAGATPTNVVTVAVAGSLSVIAASSTPSADFVLTGSADNNVAAFRFTATNEAYNVDTLSFSEVQAEADTAVTDSAIYANNVASVKITYPKADGSTGTKSVSMSGKEAKFSGLDMYVAVGSPKTVNVYVTVPSTDRDAGGAATSNEKIKLGLYVDTSVNDNFKATGVASGTTLNDSSAGIAAVTSGIATFVVRETKPTVAVASNTPSGTKAPGRQEALSFNVSAAANEDVVLSNIVFQLSSTDAAASNWNICDTDIDANTDTVADVMVTAADFDLYNFTVDGTSSSLEDQNSGTWSLIGADGATVCNATGNGDITYAKLALGTPEVIPAGSTTNFKLYFDSTGASAASDDVVRFDIPTDPIASAYVALGTSRATSGAMTIAGTTLTGAAALDTTSTGALAVGDLVKVNNEVMLVTAYTPGASTATVIRGYLGTTAATHLTAQTIYRLPGAFLWQDDGTTAVSSSNQEYWGAYLVDNLLVSGGTLVF